MADEDDTYDSPQNDEERAFASVFRTGLSRDQVDFLQSYLCTGSIKRAAKLAEMDRTRHYEWMKSALYVACFREAQRQTTIALEEEARRRAVDGVLEPVFGKEGLLGYRRRFSDSLLIELLKANDPDKFGKGAGKPADSHVDVKIVMPDNGRPDSARSS